ncbi:MAG: HEAT repeat domain-containing protein [Chlorobiota bacterium]
MAYQLKSDSWYDPEWSEMISESKVIALVEYIESGDFKAKAKALKVYKGQHESNEFWIGEISNRYGPIDTMNKGDKYIVFLRFPLHKSKKGYSSIVWSPTSGDLKVKGDKVQYDLLNTTYYSKQKYYSLELFEEFLYATQSPNESFHSKIMNKLKKNYDDELAVQYMMMLYLSSYNKYDPIFRKIAESGKLRRCLALTNLLGEIQNSNSRELLVYLLGYYHNKLQGEIVRQLAKFNSDTVGPILLSHLDKVALKSGKNRNIMNPVMNSNRGGRNQIIKTLGDIKYKPAEETLLSLLNTNDEDLFEIVIETLIKLGSKKYIEFLKSNLKSKNYPLIYQTCRFIVDKDLKECKPELMEYVSTYSKNQGIDTYLIDDFSGISYFNDSETREFLENDYRMMLNNSDTLNSYYLRFWIAKYLEVFKKLDYKNRRELIFLALYNWFGYNEDFVKHPKLFEFKKYIEDNHIKRVREVLNDSIVKDVRAIVFLRNTLEYNQNYNPEFEVNINIELNDIEYVNYRKSMDEVRFKVANEMNIPAGNICVNIEHYVSNHNERFLKDIRRTPLDKYYQYVIENCNQFDLEFLKNIKKSGFIVNKWSKLTIEKNINILDNKLDGNKRIKAEGEYSKILWFSLLGLSSIAVVTSTFIFYRKRSDKKSV